MPGRERRNALAFLGQGVFFFAGYCFFDCNTVLPMFLRAVAGRPELAGVPMTLRQLCTLLVQLLLGGYVVRARHTSRAITGFLFLGYSAPLLLAGLLFLGASGAGLAWGTFGAVALLWLSDGMISIAYYDLLGRALDARSRARVLGGQQVLGGLASLAGAAVIKLMLDRVSLPLPARYALLFLLGGGLLYLAAACMGFCRDVPREEPQRRESVRVRLRALPAVWRGCPAFRRLMACQALFTLSVMLAPYALLLCGDALALPETTISTLVGVQVAGTLLGGALSAWLGPRRGSLASVAAFCGLALLCAACGLLALAGGGLILAALMVLCSGLTGAAWAGFMGAIIDLSHGRDTPLFLLCNTLVTLPLAASGVLAGQLVLRLGYGALLALCLAFAVGAFVLALGNLKTKGETDHAG